VVSLGSTKVNHDVKNFPDFQVYGQEPKTSSKYPHS
jgi:hypothetical protein